MNQIQLYGILKQLGEKPFSQYLTLINEVGTYVPVDIDNVITAYPKSQPIVNKNLQFLRKEKLCVMIRGFSKVNNRCVSVVYILSDGVMDLDRALEVTRAKRSDDLYWRIDKKDLQYYEIPVDKDNDNDNDGGSARELTKVKKQVETKKTDLPTDSVEVNEINANKQNRVSYTISTIKSKPLYSNTIVNEENLNSRVANSVKELDHSISKSKHRPVLQQVRNNLIKILKNEILGLDGTGDLLSNYMNYLGTCIANNGVDKVNEALRVIAMYNQPIKNFKAMFITATNRLKSGELSEKKVGFLRKTVISKMEEVKAKIVEPIKEGINSVKDQLKGETQENPIIDYTEKCGLEKAVKLAVELEPSSEEMILHFVKNGSILLKNTVNGILNRNKNRLGDIALC